MSGNLYQLQTTARPGQIMTIAGPYDTYGRVIKLQDSGFHLIRGLGHQKPSGLTISK
ncbi:hypothetical protein B7L88_gp067 [Rhizobium phage RHEph10]|uniref:hypothetical protein n=1 Tax=Rhizobium phage RHEph10 TaxID=1220717 RepID=UPI0002AB3EEE|nr:hypothetical protein B7L88_gp067 [Rhizobium phage RHEph10]AGC36111.1 hypothetical protein RHEph10_gp067 [Rhizobium phage RHEph10]